MHGKIWTKKRWIDLVARRQISQKAGKPWLNPLRSSSVKNLTGQAGRPIEFGMRKVEKNLWDKGEREKADGSRLRAHVVIGTPPILKQMCHPEKAEAYEKKAWRLRKDRS
jgi:hypothetical protein